MMTTLSKKQAIALLLVFVIATILALLILFSNKSKSGADEHGDHSPTSEHKEKSEQDKHANEQNEQKGPHGGRLFTQDAYALEVMIYEVDATPVFRVYTYLNGKALAPNASDVTMRVQRLGQEEQSYSLKAEKDYLSSAVEVEEPHSFEVKIRAQHAQKTYEFQYEQIEGRVQMSEQQRKQNGVVVQIAGPIL
ncbi:MAG: efflux transporter periplasmic adaptor subunit, partial [Burkholderiales bacterium]|nr:efflux transporter periplasmic adaptor subunit [Burkholderiales bacterium]